MGLLPCEACGMVCRDEPSIVAPCCPRCDAPLHHRKRDSVRRSWAFLIAAAVLYIPANVLPIMNTSSLLYNQQNTILGGIRVLWLEGRSEEHTSELQTLMRNSYAVFCLKQKKNWMNC